ncbi:MAG: carbohydrate binding domain-containing protein, partial [Armatimonadota bacterium]
LWLRSPQSCPASVLLQLAHDPWSTVIARTVTALPQWREYTVQGRCAEDHPADDVQLSLQLAHQAGQIDIAAIRVNNLGPSAPERDLAPANPLNLIPFVLPWDDNTPSITNVSAWLDKPAGAKGFVVPRDGHLYTGDARLRFVGTNITASSAFPEHGDAEKVAARLAKFGVNCVRFHHMEAPWTSDNIFSGNKLAINPAQLEKLDYFIAQLKANGLYSNLNLHVSRVYPGFPTWEGMPEFFKGVDLFYPPMIQMQKDYARDLLTHLNPYTKTRYVDEPAVAIVEINNENGLLSQWGALDAMPAVYRDELQKQWNAWLKGKYADQAALVKAWDATPRPLGTEMLGNGDFSRGVEGWVLEQNGVAKASTSTAADGPGGKTALTIDVTAVSDQGWHVQLQWPGLKFEKSGVYTLEFDARSDSARNVSVDARMAHQSWGTLWQLDVKTTPEWKHFRLPVSVGEDEDTGRITFSNLGALTGKVQLAGVSLKPGGGFQLQPGETLGVIRTITKADFSGFNAAIQSDWTRFLWDTESAYWLEMARYLREDLGVKCPIVGTAAGFSPVAIQAQLPVVDIHAYWQHPSFPGRPWDSENWVLPNVAMAGVAGGDTLTGLAMSRVAGKPFLVTEYNHPAPNTHNSEAFLLAAAYGGLQDWDGFFSFAYEGSRDSWSANRLMGYFDVQHHPTQMATMPTAAALFLRGDMATPRQGEVVSSTTEGMYEVTRKAMPWGTWSNGSSVGLTRAGALQHPVALRLDGGPATKLAPTADAERSVSSDGQWTWDSTKGRERVLLNTARTRGLIGSTLGGPFALGDITIAPGKNLQDWAAITLTAMDGADFTQPGRLLLTATGYAENTSMGWKNEQKDTVGSDWGTGPTLVEGIPATITLPVVAARVTVYALDERGQRREKVAVRDEGGKATFDIGPACKTIWYEVEVK